MNLSNLRFKKLKTAPCVFTKRRGDAARNIFLLVYVSDILIIVPEGDFLRADNKSSSQSLWDGYIILYIWASWSLPESGREAWIIWTHYLKLSQTKYLATVLNWLKMETLKEEIKNLGNFCYCLILFSKLVDMKAEVRRMKNLKLTIDDQKNYGRKAVLGQEYRCKFCLNHETDYEDTSSTKCQIWAVGFYCKSCAVGS